MGDGVSDLSGQELKAVVLNWVDCAHRPPPHAMTPGKGNDGRISAYCKEGREMLLASKG